MPISGLQIDSLQFSTVVTRAHLYAPTDTTTEILNDVTVTEYPEGIVDLTDFGGPDTTIDFGGPTLFVTVCMYPDLRYVEVREDSAFGYESQVPTPDDPGYNFVWTHIDRDPMWEPFPAPADWGIWRWNTPVTFQVLKSTPVADITATIAGLTSTTRLQATFIPRAEGAGQLFYISLTRYITAPTRTSTIISALPSRPVWRAEAVVIDGKVNIYAHDVDTLEAYLPLSGETSFQNANGLCGWIVSNGDAYYSLSGDQDLWLWRHPDGTLIRVAQNASNPMCVRLIPSNDILLAYRTETNDVHVVYLAYQPNTPTAPYIVRHDTLLEIQAKDLGGMWLTLEGTVGLSYTDTAGVAQQTFSNLQGVVWAP